MEIDPRRAVQGIEYYGLKVEESDFDFAKGERVVKSFDSDLTHFRLHRSRGGYEVYYRRVHPNFDRWDPWFVGENDFPGAVIVYLLAIGVPIVEEE